MQKKYILALIVAALVIRLGFFLKGNSIAPAIGTKTETVTSPKTETTPKADPVIVEPISGGLSRVTKKFFGTKVSPKNSPVMPEKFSGYHTGIDFETYPEEQNKDVPIYAMCAGKLLVKRTASGYGGVLVQSCTLDKQAVTVVYGHVKLASVTAKIGQELKAGEEIAILGKGYSSETDGERKHLHLDIHKGTEINILGYVSAEAQLTGWMDPEKILTSN